MLNMDYSFSVNSRPLNSARVSILGLSRQICKVFVVSSFGVLAVLSINSDFSSAVSPSSLLHSNKCCPTGESPLPRSSILVNKCWTVCPT